ncbi:chemoreceptor glutamine deamidase CheD [Chromobacterium haemolyticum]|uniref:chemoreceptor glutamine deamidase CheD n=1 Tax=Chromobacterium haemolyticum TaxID=394935 RepID=UPI00307F0FF1
MNSGAVHFSSHSYFDKHFQSQAVKVFPGGFYVTSQPQLLVTLLGSCVAVCMLDRAANVAGMNHFLLPEGSIEVGEGASAARFGVHAMELMITEMQKLGAMRHRMEAKVFGGGNVLDGMSVMNVGERNRRFIHAYLDAERIPILAEDLLGDCARKVYFFTDSGKVLVKKLKRSRTVITEENRYRLQVMQPEVAGKSGDIELFI